MSSRDVHEGTHGQEKRDMFKKIIVRGEDGGGTPENHEGGWLIFRIIMHVEREKEHKGRKQLGSLDRIFWKQ